jgi:lipopolysaccharide exporter
MFGLRMSNRVLGLARTAIIARLLLPDDLGLFGIVLLAQTVIEAFASLGLTSALVRRPGDVDPYLDTAWVIALVRGLVVAGLVAGAAPLIAAFFKEPAATDLIRILAVTSAFNGFNNPALANLRRHLRFGQLYWVMFVPSLADVIVSIAIVAVYRSPVALVLGLVAKAAVNLGVGYVVVRYRPRLSYDRARGRELLSYSRWITGSNILRFLHSQGDDIMVGRFLGTASLGLYQIGYRYSNLPATEITHVVQMVALPVYAQVQNDAVRLRKAFLEAVGVTSLISIALAGYIWAITPDFVELVLGPRWLGVIPVMRLLVICGAVDSLSEIPIALFQAVDRPQLGTRRLLVKTLTLAALIYPLLVWWQIRGVCIAVLVSALPALVWSLADGTRIAGASGWHVVGSLGVPSLAAGLSVAGGLLLGVVLPTGSLWSLVSLTLLCIVIYAAVVLIAQVFGYRALAQLRRRLRSVLAKQQ